MDDQPSFFSSQDNFDPGVGSFDQGFDDLMFSDAGFYSNVFDSSIDLPLDAVEGSPGLDLSLEEKEEGNSSGTPATKRRDRSKTIVSERRRRSKMKEKLHELRSLVPNITKMDKASIIGDAVVYVQSLKDQAKKLANEISVFELSTSRAPPENLVAKRVGEWKNKQCGGKIVGVLAHEVEEGRFYVRVECNNGDGVAPALYRAIESLECFHLENSDVSLAFDRFVMRVSLNANGAGEVMTVTSVKSWVMGALLKEGFGFDMSTI